MTSPMDRPAIPQFTGGAVLCRPTIEACHGHIFKSGYDFAMVQSASYDLRIGTTKLILPTGERVREPKNHLNDIILHPGDAIFASTYERLCLPDWLAGNVGPKFTSSVQGLLILSGLMVQPLYGAASDTGQPLHFLITNVGSTVIPLRPGQTAIASLQLVRVATPRAPGPTSGCSISDTGTGPPSIIDSLFSSDKAALGLSFFKHTSQLQSDFTSLSSKLQSEYQSLDKLVHSSVASQRQLIFFGWFLFTTAIIGAVFTIFLGWVGDATIHRRVKAAISALPHTAWGVIGIVVIILGLYALQIVLARFIDLVRSPRRDPSEQ